MNDIRSARYVRDHVVHLEFDDGLEGDVVLSPYLGRGPVFSPLAEIVTLQAIYFGGRNTCLAERSEITPERLYEMTENANHAGALTRAAPTLVRPAGARTWGLRSLRYGGTIAEEGFWMNRAFSARPEAVNIPGALPQAHMKVAPLSLV
jgi:hypothetical protein